MRILFAIVSCHAFRDTRANMQRATWVKDVPPHVDVRFFVGRREGYKPLPDEVVLDADDDYKGLVAKTQLMRRWSHEQGYDFVLKLDDDVLLIPERALASGFETFDYMGRLRGPSGGFPAPYASGFAYWTSRRAIEATLNAKPNGDTAEDRFLGNLLLARGIECVADYRYVVTMSANNAISSQEGPRKGNLLIASCEHKGKAMETAYRQWKEQPASPAGPLMRTGPLSKVCVMVKTFLRDGYLWRTVGAIQKNMPEARIVVVDDGYESRDKIVLYAKMRAKGHAALWMPFDSGFGAKSNKSLEAADREYLLVASDDFEFGDPVVRGGIEKLVKVLETDPSIDIASGRVNGKAYEATLELGPGWCRETSGHRGSRLVGGITVNDTDLTVNFSLIRRSILGMDKIHWDSDVKIGGGEHGAFFIDVKRAGHKVVQVPGVNINEMRLGQGNADATYPAMRARARQPGRICLKRRGIDTYHLMGGTSELT